MAKRTRRPTSVTVYSAYRPGVLPGAPSRFLQLETARQARMFGSRRNARPEGGSLASPAG
jgi:hypothetical protein